MLESIITPENIGCHIKEWCSTSVRERISVVETLCQLACNPVQLLPNYTLVVSRHPVNLHLRGYIGPTGRRVIGSAEICRVAADILGAKKHNGALIRAGNIAINCTKGVRVRVGAA